jgi:hypothetical protein
VSQDQNRDTITSQVQNSNARVSEDQNKDSRVSQNQMNIDNGVSQEHNSDVKGVQDQNRDIRLAHDENRDNLEMSNSAKPTSELSKSNSGIPSQKSRPGDSPATPPVQVPQPQQRPPSSADEGPKNPPQRTENAQFAASVPKSSAAEGAAAWPEGGRQQAAQNLTASLAAIRAANATNHLPGGERKQLVGRRAGEGGPALEGGRAEEATPYQHVDR